MSTLDELNPKQRAKEFKAMQKAIGSKDIAVKLAALDKLNDSRYFTEGACLQPFFDSLGPSKKLLDYTPTALAWLANKLKHNHTLPLPENDILNTLHTLSKDGNDLSFLKSFVLALTFREEIKYPKSKKKLAEFIPPRESSAYIVIREEGLKCLYYLTLPLQSNDLVCVPCQQLLAGSIIDIIPTLTDTALGYYSQLKGIPKEDTRYYVVLQHAYYAWRSLCFFTRYHQYTPSTASNTTPDSAESSPLVVLGHRQDLNDVLPLVLSDPVLGQSAAIILLSLLQLPADHMTFSSETFLTVLEQYERVGKGVNELTKPVEAVPLGKNGKPLPTPAGAAPAAAKGVKGSVAALHVEEVNPMDTMDMIKYDPLRQFAIMSYYYAKILTLLLQRPDRGAAYFITPSALVNDENQAVEAEGTKQSEEGTKTIATRIVNILQDYLLEDQLWSCMHAPLLTGSADEVLYDVLLTQPLCVLELLTHVSNSTPIREKMMQAGAISLVQSFLLHSTAMYAQASENKETDNSLFLFRARGLAENTIMHLLTAPLPDLLTLINESAVSGEEGACRLTPCEKYPLNLSETIPLTGDQFWSKVLLTIQSMANDSDLGTRGVRILASILAGRGAKDENTLSFVASNKLDVLFTAPLGIYLDLALAKYASSVTTAPTMIEGIYDAFVCLEMCLSCVGENTVQNIKIFADKNRLQNIANFLQLIGPNVEKPLQEECNVQTHDARAFQFSTQTEIETVEGNYRIRSLIIDVLSIIVASDALFRKFEGGVAMPLPPLTSVPVITSPTEECALNTIIIHADSIIQILSLGSELSVMKNTDHSVVLPGISVKAIGCGESVRHDEVIQSSLAFLIAAGSSTLGLPSILLSIALKGWDQASFAQSSVKSVANVFLPELLDTSPEESFQTAVNIMGTAWKRPQFFDEVFLHGIDTDLTVEGLKSIPQLWPFLALAKSFLAIIADPSYSSKIAGSALQALQALTKSVLFTEECQSVVVDLLITSFFLLGGGVALLGLIGRFGQLDEENRHVFQALTMYLFSRGQQRESFWLKWANDHKEEVIIDPKTGKPIVKKEEKKKEPPKDTKKKDGKGEIPIVSVLQPEMTYNLETTEPHPDPNHGPSNTFWKILLNLPARSAHLVSEEMNLLIASVQGKLTDLSLLLLTLGIDVNYHTTQTALMYAFVLDDMLVVDALLEHPEIDVNILDRLGGTPTVFYSLMSVDEELLQRAFTPQTMLFPTVEKERKVLGNAKYLQKLINTAGDKLDLFVRDQLDGNSILLTLLGLGHVKITVGACPFDIQHVAYHAGSDSVRMSAILDNVQFLVNDHQADINMNNKAGFTPLTIAACRDDVELVKYLLAQRAAVSRLDSKGIHVLHHVLACAPSRTIELVDILIKAATFRPLTEYSFSDDRTGKNQQEKKMLTLTQQMDALLTPVFSPMLPLAASAGRGRGRGGGGGGGGGALSQIRLQRKDVLCLKSSLEGFSLLIMSLAGEEIVGSNGSGFNEVINEMIAINNNTKSNRIRNALHLCSLATEEKCLQNVVNIDNVYQMTVMHAAALCLKGKTTQVPLTAAQIRSKRVKSYPSDELKLLDILMQHLLPISSSIPSNSNSDDSKVLATLPACFLPLPCMGDYQPWTILHAALVHANLDYLQTMLDHGFDVVAVRPVHFFAQLENKVVLDEEVCMWLINLCTKHEEYKVLLSSPYPSMHGGHEHDDDDDDDQPEQVDDDNATNSNNNSNNQKYVLPLHAAVLSKQLPLIKALVACSKVDLNARMGDKLEGSPALALACRSIGSGDDVGGLSLLQAFASGKDRLDLTLPYRIPATGQVGSVVEEVVLVLQNAAMLRELIAMRRNDVIEQALAPRKRSSEDDSNTGGGGSLFEVLKARGPGEMVEILRSAIREVIADFDQDEGILASAPEEDEAPQTEASPSAELRGNSQLEYGDEEDEGQEVNGDDVEEEQEPPESED